MFSLQSWAGLQELRFLQQPQHTRGKPLEEHPLLTFQDISSLQLLHGWSLAQPSAEKHQDYVLHHGGTWKF